ncbi:hypothetical protein C5167_002344 [Papaver somniferum]|uniref:Uncharacterized protein n=1 Tax=Papaver somniferum TaxID=3469 RepID=A0A4Y7L1T3_PAPSO|nr:uncharacterized protein LOC113309749 [Papaver somniferum]RZC78155.1 hypothetical protein C5167_002344 [Papaver somniferum]
MARISLIFSFAFTGFIMLSMSQIALGVSRSSQLLPKPAETVVVTKATTEKTGNTQAPAAKKLVQMKDSGAQGVNLKKDEVYHVSKTEANGEVVVKRGVASFNPKNSKKVNWDLPMM